MYFPDDPRNEADSIFQALGADKSVAIARVLPPAQGETLFGWDIVLHEG